ncbi:ATP-binding protein [Nonomuraea salmonea]|uniref:ATP-binding protein n=1 Tax=Nonomuraea salmonea TaxID=46181 RepID=A0ABV5NMW1_9ACTN
MQRALAYTSFKVWLIDELDDPRRLPALARREVHAWVRDQPALDDLQLIASELVANAVEHGGGRWVRLSLLPVQEGGGYYWRLAVIDPGGSGAVPLPQRPTPEDTRGRGLWLVHRLTGGCWGTDVTRVGERVVWALLPRTERSGRPRTDARFPHDDGGNDSCHR